MTQRKFDPTFLSVLKAGLCAASLAVAAMFTTGCDSGSGGGGKVSAPASDPAFISGNVQDQHGPIMKAKIEVHDKNGQLITTTELSGNSNAYSVDIPAGTAYPIVLTATPTEGLNTDPVKAVVTSPLADRMDITDVTTIVVNSAITLGGLTSENIAKASGGAIGLRQRQGAGAGAGGGGAGPGQSGGGTGYGGHGGHKMSGMGGGGSSSTEQGSEQPQQEIKH